MYRDPIKVDSNDPLLSATSLEGTVIGILFEKSGEEIKLAIQARAETIDKEIRKNVEMILPIRDFLKSKEDLIADIEIYEENRRVERGESLKPLMKKQEEANEVLRRISEEIRVSGKDFDLKTHGALKKELKKFKTGWEQIDSQLEDLEKVHLEEVWKVNSSIAGITNNSTLTVTTGHAYNISTCDNANTSGRSSASSESCSSMGFYSPVYTPTNWQLARGDIEVDGTFVSHKLRRKVEEYKDMFKAIKSKIDSLELEKRRLEMISRNISSDRKFKLSLVQLSAFGFEDIEVR